MLNELIKDDIIILFIRVLRAQILAKNRCFSFGHMQFTRYINNMERAGQRPVSAATAAKKVAQLGSFNMN